jgi:cytoskeleton protein RodZ
VVTTPAIGQAQAAQPPTPVDQPRSGATPSPTPVEEATARSPTADAAAAASLPVKIDTPVRVRTNSWVELRAPNGDILAQTYVRAGESYVVPAGIAYRVIDAR